jgi:hypothetical protein
MVARKNNAVPDGRDKRLSRLLQLEDVASKFGQGGVSGNEPGVTCVALARRVVGDLLQGVEVILDLVRGTLQTIKRIYVREREREQHAN